MTIQELRTEISYFTATNDTIGLVLYVIYNDENNIEQIRVADIDDESRLELKDQYLEYLNDKILDNEDLTIMNISDADNRKNAIYNYDLDERPFGLNPILIIKENEEHPQFSFRQDDFDNITAFVITIGSESRKILLFKKHHRLSVLRGQNAFGIRISDHRFVRVREDIIKLSPKIDFLQINDNLIINSLKTLEGGFGYEGVIRNKATQNISAIDAINLLDDINVLREMAVNIKHAKHIMRIKSNSPVMTLPISTVISFVQSHRPIMRKFRISEDGLRLKLDTDVSKKLFLSLMNDNLLTSELTKLYYEGVAKDEMLIEEEIN